MRFEKALAAMREGKVVACSIYGHHHAMTKINRETVMLMWVVGEAPREACMPVDDILSEDWEIIGKSGKYEKPAPKIDDAMFTAPLQKREEAQLEAADLRRDGGTL